MTGLATSAARPSARYQGRALFSSPLSTAHAAAPARPGTVDMRNGDKVALPFTAQEYDRRVGCARGVMEDLALDGMVLTSMQNVTYHSGFTYCSFGRNYALVLGPASSAGSLSAGSGHKDSGVTVSAGIDGGQPHRRCHGDNLTYTDWGRDNFFSTVCSALTPAAFGPGKVGEAETAGRKKGQKRGRGRSVCGSWEKRRRRRGRRSRREGAGGVCVGRTRVCVWRICSHITDTLAHALLHPPHTLPPHLPLSASASSSTI